MTNDLRTKGRELLSGSLGGPWSARAAEVARFIEASLGEGPPNLESLPDPKLAAGHRLRRLPATPKQRRAAEECASKIVSAVVERRFDRLAALLQDQVWVLWPNGQLARHERDVLVPALAQRAGATFAPEIDQLRSYAPAEARSTLPRGVPEAVEQLLGGASPMIVTLFAGSASGSSVGLSLFVSEHESGSWRAHNLPVAEVDGAVRAGVGASRDDDEAVRMADRLVRHFVYGHEKHVAALRNHLMDRVLLSADRLEPSEKLAALAAEGPHRFDALDTVFLGTTLAGLTALERRGGRVLMEALKRRSKEAWGRPFERLKVRVTSTKLATIGPALEPTSEREVLTVQIGVRDKQDGAPERWRLGALLV